jgi:hypothetical protein
MGQPELFKSKYFQIFIAILIPNLGSWILLISLAGEFEKERVPIKSYLDPPGWVRINQKLISTKSNIKNNFTVCWRCMDIFVHNNGLCKLESVSFWKRWKI